MTASSDFGARGRPAPNRPATTTMTNTSRRRKQASSTARGLGHDHQVQRARLLNRHVDGSSCWWCGKPLYRNPARNPDGRVLHADHSRPRSTYGRSAADRLLHASCNESRGDGTRDDQRPALTRPPGWDPLLGVRVFDWP